MTLDIQALTMLHMLGAGVFLGISYETYSRLRMKQKQWLTLIQDLVFWIINGMIVFLWLQNVNTGEMRLYIFLSLICGYAMYKALLQRIYKTLLEWVIRSVIWSYRTLVKTIRILIVIPIIWIYKAILAILLFLFGILAAIGKFLFKAVLFILSPFWKGLRLMWRKWGPKKQSRSTDDGPDKNRTLDWEGFLKKVDRKSVV